MGSHLEGLNRQPVVQEAVPGFIGPTSSPVRDPKEGTDLLRAVVPERPAAATGRDCHSSAASVTACRTAAIRSRFVSDEKRLVPSLPPHSSFIPATKHKTKQFRLN